MLSARGLLTRAAVIAALFAVCHLAGMREYASFLCGMAPCANGLGSVLAFLGLIYVLAYLSFVVLVPVLAIASGLLWGWHRIDRTTAR